MFEFEAPKSGAGKFEKPPKTAQNRHAAMRRDGRLRLAAAIPVSPVSPVSPMRQRCEAVLDMLGDNPMINKHKQTTNLVV